MPVILSPSKHFLRGQIKHYLAVKEDFILHPDLSLFVQEFCVDILSEEPGQARNFAYSNAAIQNLKLFSLIAACKNACTPVSF